MNFEAFSPGRLAELACIFEATARKPGNVHRFRDFDDTSYIDFILSAGAIVAPLDEARRVPLGMTILHAVQATRRVVDANTNLGMILLLAPLATVREGIDLRTGVAVVVRAATIDDSRHVYQAIRLARPGGLGRADEQDVGDEPTMPLRALMALARDRDLVARQYADDFTDVFDIVLPALEESLDRDPSLERAILFAYMTQLARTPDSLIARKRGNEVAAEVSRRAAELVKQASWDAKSIAEFDGWLRLDGHTLNPGATADLVAAALFVALKNGTIELPRPNGQDGWSNPS